MGPRPQENAKTSQQIVVEASWISQAAMDAGSENLQTRALESCDRIRTLIRSLDQSFEMADSLLPMSRGLYRLNVALEAELV